MSLIRRSVSLDKWAYTHIGSFKLTAHKLSDSENEREKERHLLTHPYKKWHLNLQLPFLDRTDNAESVCVFIYWFHFKWHILWIDRYECDASSRSRTYYTKHTFDRTSSSSEKTFFSIEFKMNFKQHSHTHTHGAESFAVLLFFLSQCLLLFLTLSECVNPIKIISNAIIWESINSRQLKLFSKKKSNWRH